jgi:hypothetical protein
VRIDFSKWTDEELLAEGERRVLYAENQTAAASDVWKEFADRQKEDVGRVEAEGRLLQARRLLVEAYGNIRDLRKKSAATTKATP